MVALKFISTLSALAATIVAAPTDVVPGVFALDFEIHDKQDDGQFQKRSGAIDEKYKNEDQMYIAQVRIGSKKEKLRLQIDTGSSDMWVPSSSTKGFNFGTFNAAKSSTFKNLSEIFEIQYGDYTYANGDYAEDTVYFGEKKNVAVLENFQFGFVDDTNVTISGLLGIGLESLEATTTFNGTQDVGPEYVNFPVAMKNAGYISSVSYSLYMTSKKGTQGTILFGGKDLAKIDGDLVKLEHSGEVDMLSVNLQSIVVEGNTIPVKEPMLLDSGTTLTYLPPDAWDSMMKIYGGSNDTDENGFPYIDCSASGNLTYVFDGINIDIPVTDLIVKDKGGLCAMTVLPGDNILGDTFLQYVYAFYDLEDKSVSIGNVKYTKESNIVSV